MEVSSKTLTPNSNGILENETISIRWFRRKLLEWGRGNLRDFPWRNTTDPYHLLVAESLLQKTEASMVAPIYGEFLQKFPTVQMLATADPIAVNKILEPLGLHFRAKRLQDAAISIENNHDGCVPKTWEELLDLPGIGDYSARAIASQAFGKPLAVLDANVARIIERFFGIQGERVKSRCKILWAAANIVAPPKNVGRWNLILIDFGALVCKAKKPLCHTCSLSSKCHHFSVSSHTDNNDRRG
jgi:A/G-specific adenine glycosylase